MTDDSFKHHVSRDSSGQYVIPALEAKIVAIVHNGMVTTTVPPNDECDVVLDRTQFYAEAGGQAGDRGTLRWGSAIFHVKNTYTRSGYVFHRGQLTMGALARADAVQALVDRKWRLGCMQHHTGTHLIMSTLERLLGPVRQRSSKSDAESAKLGFWCAAAVTPDTILRLEKEANEVIKRNPIVYVDELPLEKCKQVPEIRWILGEYYPDLVRVVSIGVPGRNLLDRTSAAANKVLAVNDPNAASTAGSRRAGGTDELPFSAELCGGTHVQLLGDLQSIRVVALEGSGSSVKTVAFVVGTAAANAEELGRQLGEEIVAVSEKVRDNKAKPEALLELRAKVVDAQIPFETKTHLLHNILDLRKSHLKQNQPKT